MIMRHRFGFVCITALLTLTGCSRFAVDNSSLDYQQARALPPLQLPADQATRPFVPQYPVPELRPSTLPVPVFTNTKGNRFVMPAPAPLSADAVRASQQVDTGKPTAPTLVMDGNGYPLLRIDGNSDRIWDALGQALVASGINVTDRNLTLARVDLTVQNTPLMLRLDRNGNATRVTVQDAKDALADKTTATDLLNQIIQHWPS
jgi:uncharacterized lipoprotein